MVNIRNLVLVFILLIIGAVAGCFHNETDNDGADLPKGYFFDAPVYGLAYDGPGFSGMTGSYGSFRFKPGSPVTFSFAGLELGTVTLNEPGSIVTPPDLRGIDRSDFANNTATINILRLLLTLDEGPNDRSRIVVPDRFGVESAGLGDKLARLAIGDPYFETQVESYLGLFNDVGYRNGKNLVPAEQAIAHFENTLSQLSAPPPSIIGEWEIRGEQFGEFSGRLTLNANNTGELVEYHDCSGSDETAWVASEERAKSLCSTTETYAINWDLSGRVLTINTGHFTNACRFLVGNVHQFTAGCEMFVGNGAESKVQHFIRTGINGFKEDLIPGSYVEFSTGAHTSGEAALLRYTPDNRGEYTIGAESGQFDWLISDDQTLEIAMDGESGAPEILTFQEYIVGAAEYHSDEHAKVFVAIPDYGGHVGPRVHRYDMIDGTLISSYESISYHPDLTDHGEVFTEDEKVCRKIHQISIREALQVYWMNCSNTDGDGTHSYELWRQPHG